VKAAECEKQAAAARDPEIRLYYTQLARHYTQLARHCWDMARQARAQRLQANIIIGQELRAYHRACTTEEPPPRLLALLKKLDEETEPSAKQVG
jgi:hypothetical protein